MGVKFFLILCLGAILQDAMGNLSKRSYNPKFRHVNKKYLKAIPSEFDDNNERGVMEEMYLLDTKTNKLTKTDVVLVSMGMDSSSLPLDKEPTDFPKKAYNKHSTLGHQKSQQKPTFSQDDSMMIAQPQINGPPIVLQLLGWSGNPPPPLVLPQISPKVDEMASVKPIGESIEMPVSVNAMKKPADDMILLIEDDQKASMKKPAEVVELNVEKPQMMPVCGEQMPNGGSVVVEEKKPVVLSDQMAADSMILLVQDDQKDSMKKPEEIVELKVEQPQMIQVSGEQMPNGGSVIVEEKKPVVLSDTLAADSMILLIQDDQKDSMKKPEEIFELKVNKPSMMPVVVEEIMQNMASNKQEEPEIKHESVQKPEEVVIEEVKEPQVMLVSQEELSNSASEKKKSSEIKNTEEAPLTLVAPAGSLPIMNETTMPVTEIEGDVKVDVEMKIAAMDQKEEAIAMESMIPSTDIKVQVESQKKPEIEKMSASKEEMKISAMDEQPMKVSVPVPEMILIEKNEKKPEAILVPEILTEVNNKKSEVEKMTTEASSEEEIKKTDSMVEKPNDKQTLFLIEKKKVEELLFCFAALMREVSVSVKPFKPAFSTDTIESTPKNGLKSSNLEVRLERCKMELEELKRKNSANSMTVPQETMKPVTNTNESLMNKDQELAVKEPFQKPAASSESASEHKPAAAESNSDIKVMEESTMKDESVIVVKPAVTQKPIRRKRPNHHKPKPHRPRPTKKPAASSTTTSSTTTAESSSAEQSSTASPSSTTSAEAPKVKGSSTVPDLGY